MCVCFSDDRFPHCSRWTVRLVLYQVTKCLITTKVHRNTHWLSQPQTKDSLLLWGQCFCCSPFLFRALLSFGEVSVSLYEDVPLTSTAKLVQLTLFPFSTGEESFSTYSPRITFQSPLTCCITIYFRWSSRTSKKINLKQKNERLHWVPKLNKKVFCPMSDLVRESVKWTQRYLAEHTVSN